MRTPTPPKVTGTRAPEVVAGLVNDGSAAQVAATAVRLARDTGGRVRFVQVVSPGLSAEDRADAEAATFGAALRALRGRPRVAATFEAPAGDAGRVLVERSRSAIGLVVGEDRNEPVGEPGVVARYCREHAHCAVVVVVDT